MGQEIAISKSCHFLLLESGMEETWGSFKSLKEGVKLFFEDEFAGKISHLSISTPTSLTLLELDKIRELNPQHIVIIDHKFIPEVVTKILDNFSDTRVWIHLWGSLISRLKDLQSSGLLGRVGFICGSQSQLLSLQKLLGPDAPVKYLPSIPQAEPLEPSEPSFREKYCIKADEKLFIYTGRVSFAKNVHSLLKLFEHYTDQGGTGSLILAGSTDNLNTFTKPKAYTLGFTAELFFQELERLQEKGIRAYYTGHLDHSELATLFSEADHFVSLSTAEEEDFGMSIWEALSFGIPCTLTSWGGYREFEGIEGVDLLRVNRIDGTLVIDSKSFLDSVSSTKIKSDDVKLSFEKWKKSRRVLQKRIDFDIAINSAHCEPKFSSFQQDYFFNEYHDYLSSYWE